jgi:LPXTG-motif cell wall-anchored protein
MTLRSRILRVAAGSAIAAAALIPATAVFAGATTTDCGVNASPSKTDCNTTVSTDGPQVLGETVTKAASPSGTLPFTGSDVTGLTLIGLGVLGAGGATVVVSRRRRSAEV